MKAMFLLMIHLKYKCHCYTVDAKDLNVQNNKGDFASPDPEPVSPVISDVFLMLPGTFYFKRACRKMGFRIRANKISLQLGNQGSN